MTAWLELPSVGDRPPLRCCVPTDPPDRIAVDIANGTWVHPAPLRLVLDLVEPGMVLLDLGAHLGTVSLLAAQKGARVVAVEASPTNARCLAASVAANQLDVTVLQVAVGAAPGRVRFREEGPFGQITAGDDGVEVEVLTVPDILRRSGVASPDVVKIDVEGEELAALDAMRELAVGPHVPALIVEGNGFTLAGRGFSPRDLVGTLQSLGLAVWRVGEDVLTPVPRGQLQPHTVADYLATNAPPPWPATPPLTDDDIAAALVAEAGHRVWTHRRYVAGALETASTEMLERGEVRDALEALALDAVADVRAAARWWLDRPETRSMSAVARMFRALAITIERRISAGST